jgi:hypothetical protein
MRLFDIANVRAPGPAILCAFAVATAACVGSIGDGAPPGATDEGPSGPFAPAGLRLLTPMQYQNSLQDLFGDDLAIPAVGQWRSSIAAAQGGVSVTAVEEYEIAARDLCAAVFGDPARREALVGCEPAGDAADPCMRSFLETLGRRAFRRALDAEEVDRYAAVAVTATELLGDPWRGVEHAVLGLLQSPSFLYRVELAEPDPAQPARARYTDHEMATRLSYFVWNTTPDDELLAAADEGALSTEEGLRTQLQRLAASERARAGSVHFFSDLLDLDALLSVQKDTQWLPAFTATLGPAMREQLLRTIDSVVFDGDGDYRSLFDTRSTFVNAELASLYELEGSFGDELEAVTLPESSGRAGLLTLAGLLTMYSGEADTSPTLRGKFVRSVLLCQNIPPPPAGVNTTIPEPAPDELVTTRELLSRHQTDPSCSSCHQFMDPIGLALENFDAIGAWRQQQNGLTIDASGELDGAPFDNAVGLGRELKQHPDLALCLMRSLYRYASGHIEQGFEQQLVAEIADGFTAAGYQVPSAFELVALSSGFRFAALPDPAELEEEAP